MQFQVGQFGAKKVGQFAPKRVDQVRANLVDQYHRFLQYTIKIDVMLTLDT